MKPEDEPHYVEVLSHAPVFRDLPRAALERIVRSGMWLDARLGEQVLFENMRGGMGLSVIVEGEVEVLRGNKQVGPDGEPQSVRLNALGVGSCLGEYSLIDGQSTSASARALSDCRMFFLPRGMFLQIVDRDAEVGRTIYRNLLAYLIGRLRQSNERQSAAGSPAP